MNSRINICVHQCNSKPHNQEHHFRRRCYKGIISSSADIHACMSHHWHLCVCLSTSLLHPVGAQVGGIRRIVVPVELGYPNNDYKKQGPKPTTFSVSLSHSGLANIMLCTPATRFASKAQHAGTHAV